MGKAFFPFFKKLNYIISKHFLLTNDRISSIGLQPWLPLPCMLPPLYHEVAGGYPHSGDFRKDQQEATANAKINA